MKQKFPPLILILALLAACGRPAEQAQATYETVAVAKRDIRVAVEAAGQIEPALTVELKSKASGQILELSAETGQVVEAGTLLVQIDKRNPRNSLAQAQAQLEAAKARRAIAEAQNRRSAKLLAESGLHPTVLKERVTSPGGTTAAALRELESHKVKAAFITAMEAARDRSRALAKS